LSTWADLDKVSVAKPRADGTAMLVVRDDRSPERVRETRHLSVVIAISRVARARHVLAERFGGRGTVVYHTGANPPESIVDAVTAAGGLVFDGAREHTARSPLATTTQLDAAFCDLASAVRRRVGAKSFRAALEVLESDLRRRLPDRANPEAWWTAIIELAALTGECVREKRAARWIEAPSQRLPLVLDLGKGELVMPGKLAQAIVEGGEASMLALLEATASSNAARIPMAMLCDRRSLPIDKLTWERLIPQELDTDDVPVVVFAEDIGGTVSWQFGPTAPDPVRRRTALANLAKEAVEIEIVNLPDGNAFALVTGSYYAAETLLVAARMETIRSQLGGPKVLLVGVPARGQLLAIDGERAMLDDNLERAFLLLVERGYFRAPERDRISTEVIVYSAGPIGRLQSNLMDARRALRASGVDPDA
jgi:hypothetical protein